MMQTCFSVSDVPSTTFTPSTPSDEYHTVYIYHQTYSEQRCESCSSSSPSPWPDSSSILDVEMTDSPASSYASIDQPSPYSGEYDDATSELSSVSSSSLSVYIPPSSCRLQQLSATERKAAKNSYVALKERERVARTARVKELKQKALNINSRVQPNKIPASDHQREVLRMVFDQMTPYPDEAWISRLALHFNCRYDKIKNWFSNNRQKDASEYRALHPRGKYDLAATLRQITCEGRELRLRPSALEHCSEEEWTDSFFYEVVLINDFRLAVRERNEKAHKEAAYTMLDIKNSG